MVAVDRWTGREAAALRHAQRMTVRGYAAHLGLNPSTVSNWDARGEQAQLNVETQQLLDLDLARASSDVQQRFAAALGTASTATPGHDSAPPPRTSVPPRRRPPRDKGCQDHSPRSTVNPVNRRTALAHMASPSLIALIQVITKPSPINELSANAIRPSVSVLTQKLTTIRAAYQHSRYTHATQLLPSLLHTLHSNTAARPGPIAVLLAEAYQVACGLLLKSGEPVLAAIAAERSINAARDAGDAPTLASSTRSIVHCLTAGGHPDHGADLAVTAAERLAAEARMNDPGVVSLYGALLLRGAVATAHSGNRALSKTLLDEAARAAERLGADRNLHWTAFGPTNVTAHRVAVAVELGDAGAAVAHADTVDLDNLMLPERKAMLLIDKARALTQWGRHEHALATIRDAETWAPEEIRTRPAVHTIVDDLARCSTGPTQRRVRAYASHLRVCR